MPEPDIRGCIEVRTAEHLPEHIADMPVGRARVIAVGLRDEIEQRGEVRIGKGARPEELSIHDAHRCLDPLKTALLAAFRTHRYSLSNDHAALANGHPMPDAT